MRVDPNGDIHVRQSDIGEYLGCPERMRLGLLVDDGSKFESDAAYVGTTVHAVIEHEITAFDPFMSLHEAQKFAAETFLNGLEVFAAAGNTTYSQQSFGTHIKALASVDLLVQAWYESGQRRVLLEMHPDDMRVEEYFDTPFVVLEDGRTIYLCGTPDLVLIGHNTVWDWKTASGPYQKWEKQRWAVQPTVYLWSAAQRELIHPDRHGNYTFSYQVLVRRAKVTPFETVTVERTEQNFAWLADQVTRMITFQDRMGLDTPWPTNDQSFLCSAKWCQFWTGCKGAYVDADTFT